MSGQRLSQQRWRWLETRLSERDMAVLAWLARLRLASGQQLESLCFSGLSRSSQPVVRGRVLSRLTQWGLLELVERRVGGSSKGSTSGVYRLSAAGHALSTASHAHPTKGYTDRFTAHTLAVSQVAADLVVTTRGTGCALTVFLTEPASWAADALGSFLKPDAYMQLQTPRLAMHWWLEVDLGSESLPTLERKLRVYLDFVNRGQLGPHGLVPQVLVSLSSEERLAAVTQRIGRLPPPAADLFVTSHLDQAAPTLLDALRE